MSKKLKFGVIRNESQRFSDLSPSLQSLFNKRSVEKILKQEAEEASSELAKIEDENEELTNEELDSILEDVSPQEAQEIIEALNEMAFKEENIEIEEKEEKLNEAGIPSALRKRHRRIK